MNVDTDFFGRLKGLVEIFGAAGIIALIVAVLLVVIVAFVRGTGFVFFMLFLSYAVGAIGYGGVVFAATMSRWLFLALLGLGVLKHFEMPRVSYFLFLIYVLLGFLFTFNSPVPMWSIQQAVLLLLVALCVPIGILCYIREEKNIATLFKMGIFAAAVWTGTSLLFIQSFFAEEVGRFSMGAGTVTAAHAGAFFSPFLVWGIIQKKYKFWRGFSLIVIMPFVLVQFIGSVRSGIVGMLIIASIPLLVMRGDMIKSLLILFIVGLFAGAGVFLALKFMPYERTQALMEHTLSTSTTGRIYLWTQAWDACMQQPLMGHGMGASDVGLLTHAYFHSAYLIIWYNTGLIGLLAILMFFMIYTIRTMKLVFQARTPEIADMARVTLGYMLGLGATGMVEGVFASAAGIGVTMLVIMSILSDKLISINKAVEYEDEEQPFFAGDGLPATPDIV